MQKMAEEVITRGVPEGTLRFGAVVGHRCIRLVLATMSTLVVGVKVVQRLLLFRICSRTTCGRTIFWFGLFLINLRHWANN